MTATNIIQFPTKFTGTEHSVAAAPRNPYKDLCTRGSAALLRKKLKSAGYNSRKVSVKTDFYSMGSSLNITIRCAKVNDKIVDQLCKEAECIDYCEASGEILGGCNTYVHISTTAEVDLERITPFLATAKSIIDQIAEVGATSSGVDGLRFKRTTNYDISAIYPNSSDNRNLWVPLNEEQSVATVATIIYKHNNQ